MRLASWFRDGVGGGRRSTAGGRQKAAARPAPCRWTRLEVLEDRSVPAGGVLDPTFGTGGIVSSPLGSNLLPYAVATYPQAGTTNDGKIVVGGGYTVPGHKWQFGVARYNLDGSLDRSFGGSGVVVGLASDALGAQDIAIQPDGKVLAAGVSNGDFAVVRYNVDGSLDKTFGTRGVVTTAITPNSFDLISAIALQPDGKIVAVGETAPPNSSTRELVLARYTAKGTLDPTFGTGGLALDHIPTAPGYDFESPRMGLAVDPGTGQIVVEASGPTEIRGDYPTRVIRYSGGGVLDPSFGGAGTGYVTFDGSGLPLLAFSGGLAIQPGDHRILVEGRTYNSGGRQVPGLARLNPDGTPDGGLRVTNTTSVSGSRVDGIELQSDGRVVVGSTGDVPTVAPGIFLTVARFNPDLSPDASFGTGGVATAGTLSGDSFADMALEPDGRIVAVDRPGSGSFSVDLARFLATGPQIGSFTASPTSVTAGGTVTLSAPGITDGNPNSTVTQVAFYVQVNGTNTLLGYGTPGSGVWTFTCTVNLPPGTYTVIAQATDSYGVVGDPLALDLQVL